MPMDFDSPLPNKPYVIMVVGVNGVGKTTTIGKLAYQFTKAGKKCIWALPILSACCGRAVGDLGVSVPACLSSNKNGL